MSEAKFTPGPWVLTRGQWGYHGDGDWVESDGYDDEPLDEDDKPYWLDDNGGGFHIIMQPNERSSEGSVESRALIELYDGHMPGERGYQERKANAHLIAAAPDLYESLAAVAHAIGDGEEHDLAWATERFTHANGVSMAEACIEVRLTPVEVIAIFVALARARGEATS